MTERRLRLLGRAAGFGLAAAAPGIAALAVLAVLGYLAVMPAFVAGIAILAATLAIAGRRVVAVTRARALVEALAEEAAEPVAGDLSAAVGRLARRWRERLTAAEGRALAAEAVIAAVPDPLLLIDARRRIVRANAEAAALIGTPPEPPDLAAALRNPAVLAAADAVLAGEAARIVEFVDTVPIERHLRARVARIEGPSLENAVAVLSLHDITALKRAEAMRADFVANASHELRTPLATLLGFIETLRGSAHEDADAHDRFLPIMQQQAARMARLVEDLLSLSRIELNEHVAPTGRVALAPLLHQVAEMLELRAGERRMRILLSLPGDLPEVQGDADELAQVFQNLLDNAVKYGGEGSDVAVAATPVRRAGGGEFVAVAVRDRGEGIAPAHLPRLTERFYRVDTARSRALGGTGLGLAIVKHIVNRHHGVLEIHSILGEGSTFTVSIPQAAAAAP